jgi:hypothetical protein
MPSYAEYSSDLTGVPSTPGIQTPNVLAGREVNYKPGFWEVQQAFLGSAYQGEGTAYFNLNELSNRVIPDASPVLTEPEWKESELYRPGLKYYDGMTQNEARNRADIHDDIRQREFVIEKATGAQKAAGFLSALIGGAAEPQNVASGVVASAVLGPAGPVASFAKALPGAYGTTLGSLFKAKRTIKGAIGYGAVTGAVGDALVEPLNYSAAKSFGEPYDSADVLMNIGQSALFGGLFEGGAQYLRNRRSTRVDTINEFDSVLTQLSSDEMPDPSGQRRFSMVNKYHKEYGPELNWEFDNLRFVMLDNERGLNIKDRDKTPGLLEFIPDRVIHWAIDSEDYHVQFNGDVYEASPLRYKSDELEIYWPGNTEPTRIKRETVLEWLSKAPDERTSNADVEDSLRYVFKDNEAIMNAGDPVHTGVMDPEAARFLSWMYQDPIFEGRVPTVDSVRSGRSAQTPLDDIGHVPKADVESNTFDSISGEGVDADLYPEGDRLSETREPYDIGDMDADEPGAIELAKVQSELDALIQTTGDSLPEDLLALSDELRDRGETIDDMMNAVVVCALRTAAEVAEEIL